MKRILTSLFFLLIINAAFSQFVINPNATINQLINNISGGGVVISNPVLNCPTGAYGTFNGGNNSTPPLGIGNGILLTSGTSTGVDQAATNLVSQPNNGPGDPLINNISPSPLNSFDRCRLEFDIQVTGDTLRFDYVFGSEEYTSFVCTNYNDAFGFFVSGPIPGGGNYTNQNVALIPGTNIPVMIGSINDGTPNGSTQPCYTTYTNLYTNNTGGTTIAYDGFTVPLRAQFPTIPCSTYHIILIIADVGDGSLDSGVFLEAGSFQSTSTFLSSASIVQGVPFGVEGCVNGQIRFEIDPALTQPYTINYTIGGTATNGVDYNTIASTITIPPGDTLATIPIIPINDGISEGMETIKIYLNNPCTGLPYDSTTFNIFDSIPLQAQSNKYSICLGDTCQFSTSGGTSYIWTPANSGLSSYTIGNPIAIPTQTTTYQVQTTLAGCTVTDTFTVFVSQPDFTVDVQPVIDSICANETVQLTTNVSAGSGPYTYQWSPVSAMNPVAGNISNPTVTPIQTTLYNVTVTGSTGCRVVDSTRIVVAGVGPQVTATANPLVVCPGTNVQLDFTSNPLSCGPNYTGCVGINVNDSVGNAFNIQGGSPVIYPSIYGNYAFSARHLMLWTAAELQAEFGAGGTISSLGFEIGNLGSNATLQNYTIKMRCVPTSTTALSSWWSGMNTVFTPKNYVPVLGWNMHNLDTLFNWDGVSNLLVEVCFSGTTSGNMNNKMVYTTTPTNTLYYKSGGTSGNGLCTNNLTTNSFGSTQRPKIRMVMCQPDYNSFSINWSPSSGSNAVSNPAIKNPTTAPQTTQTYQVQVSQNGCTGSNFVTVTVDTTIRVNAGNDISVCSGQNINLNATPIGTVSSPSYAWTTLAGINVGNTQAITTAVAGTYVVTMINGGCTYRDTVVVTIGQLGISNTITPIQCSDSTDGQISLTPSGTAPFAFQWSANAATGNQSTAINLAPGSYLVTVTDFTNCTGTATFTLNPPSAITFPNPQITAPLCNGDANGQISSPAQGGTGTLNYSWQHNLTLNSFTANNLATGNYVIIAQDGNGCIDTAHYFVPQPSPVSWNSVNKGDISCFGGTNGSILVNASGGTGSISYNWSNDPSYHLAQASNLSAGSYTISALDVNGCSIDTTLTIAQPLTAITFNAPNITNASCFTYCDGSATVNPTGGSAPYTYVWNNLQTTQTATGLCAGNISVIVTDDSSCQATTTITITEPVGMTINEIPTNSNCFNANNGSIDITVLNAQGTPNYAWSHGPTAEDATGLAPGSYTVVVTDASSCSVSETWTITQPTQLQLGNVVVTPVSCFGGNNGVITTSPSGGSGSYSFNWSPGGGSVASPSGLTANTYSVTMTEATNATCQVTGTYIVTEPSTVLSISNSTINDANCFGSSDGSISITVSGGTQPYSYSWNGGTPNAPTNNNIPANSYNVVVTDFNNCTTTGSYTVNQPTQIQAAITVLNNVSCNGGNNGKAVVTATGATPGYTYLWNNLATIDTASGFSAGSISVVVTDGNGCTVSATSTIVEPAAISIILTPTAVSCFGGSDGTINSNVSGGTPGYTYLWSTTDATPSISNLTSNLYSITVTDLNGCSSQNSATVSQPTQLNISLSGNAISCIGTNDGTIQSTVSGGTPGYNFNLLLNGSSIAANNNGNFSGLSANQYTVEVEDLNGCTNSATINLAAAVADVINWSVDSTSCFGPQYTDGSAFVEGLTPQNMPYQYSIDGGLPQYNGDFFNLSAGPHVLTITNFYGCTTTVNIIVPQPLQATAIIVPSDTVIQLGQGITLNTVFGPYSESYINSIIWTPSLGLNCVDCMDPIASPYSEQTTYQVLINYGENCTTSASAIVRVENNNLPYIPNVFSPNGDGNNDVFNILGFGIRTVDLRIFNRWGELIYDSNNQWIGWDGTYKSQLQSPAVYTYYAYVTYLDGKTKEMKGTVTLVR